MAKMLYWILGFLAAILAIAIWWFVDSNQAIAPTDLPESSRDSTDSETGEEQGPAAEGIDLMPVASFIGSGTATRLYDGTTFTHTVTASIDDPPDGTFYEGWLVRPAPAQVFISTGALSKSEEGYTLTFTAKQDYSDYPQVVITQETLSAGLDGKPETHVLEGSF